MLNAKNHPLKTAVLRFWMLWHCFMFLPTGREQRPVVHLYSCHLIKKKKTALCDSHMATEVTVRPPCRDNSCQPVRSTWWDVMKQSCSVSFTGKQIALSVTFDYNQRWWLCSQREAEPRPTSLKNGVWGLWRFWNQDAVKYQDEFMLRSKICLKCY